MANIQTYGSPQVADSGASPTFLQTPNAPSAVVQNNANAQTEQLGQAATRAGDAANAMALDMQQRANQIRVDDAVNQAKEAAMRLTFDKQQGFTNIKGIDALQRPDGKPLAVEYGENLRKQLGDIQGGLGNDLQKQAFGQHAVALQQNLEAQATRHENEQYQNYTMSVREATISTRMNEIGLNWNNPQVIDGAVESIRAATYDQSRLLGKSAEWADAQAQKAVSNAHKVALGAALERNDIAYASGYLKKYSGQMDADDLLRTQGLITKEMDSRLAIGTATKVMQNAAPSIVNTDADRAFTILKGAESGGKQFGADGQPLTSSAGAIGVAQVMPATGPEAAKLAGLSWDEERFRNDPKYNEALGRAYFQKKLQDNSGNLAYAYAGYNAGQGRLEQGLKEKAAWDKAHPGQEATRPWLSFLPKETQDYVTKNVAAYDAGGGVAKRPTLLDMHAAVREQLGPDAKPQVVRAAIDETTRQFEDTTKAIKQQGDANVVAAMRALQQNGGRFSDLPVAVRAAIPPEEEDKVRKFGQEFAKGDNITSPWLYNKLSQPDNLAKLSEDEFYKLHAELSESDFQHFSDLRAKNDKRAAGTGGPGDLNGSAIKQGLDERLRQLKIDPTPKDDGGEDASRVGGIRRFVDQYMANAQKEAGKKFTDTEVAQHLDGLFAKNTTLNGFFKDSSGPLLGMKVGDLTSEQRTKIKEVFKRNGNENPTDAQIMQVFFQSKVAQAPSKGTSGGW